MSFRFVSVVVSVGVLAAACGSETLGAAPTLDTSAGERPALTVLSPDTTGLVSVPPATTERVAESVAPSTTSPEPKSDGGQPPVTTQLAGSESDTTSEPTPSTTVVIETTTDTTETTQAPTETTVVEPEQQQDASTISLSAGEPARCGGLTGVDPTDVRFCIQPGEPYERARIPDWALPKEMEAYTPVGTGSTRTILRDDQGNPVIHWVPRETSIYDDILPPVIRNPLFQPQNFVKPNLLGETFVYPDGSTYTVTDGTYLQIEDICSDSDLTLYLIPLSRGYDISGHCSWLTQWTLWMCEQEYQGKTMTDVAREIYQYIGSDYKEHIDRTAIGNVLNIHLVAAVNNLCFPLGTWLGHPDALPLSGWAFGLAESDGEIYFHDETAFGGPFSIAREEWFPAQFTSHGYLRDNARFQALLQKAQQYIANRYRQTTPPG